MEGLAIVKFSGKEYKKKAKTKMREAMLILLKKLLKGIGDICDRTRPVKEITSHCPCFESC